MIYLSNNAKQQSYIQKKELSLQREELTQTREELKGQKEQLEEQNKTLKIQRFENTFFQMSKLPDWHPTHISRQYIGMRDIIQSLGYDGYMESNTPTYFDHYFRFLYRILKFIYTSPLVSTFEEEYEYTSMLMAMVAINDMTFQGSSIFYKNVKMLMMDKRVNAVPQIQIKGRSGIDFTFDYVVSRPKVEFLVQAVGNLDTNKLKRRITSFGRYMYVMMLRHAKGHTK